MATCVGMNPRDYRATVADGSPELDQRLSDELDAFNAAATPGIDPARELTVQLHDATDDLAAGISG